MNLELGKKNWEERRGRSTFNLERPWFRVAGLRFVLGKTIPSQ